MINLQGESGNGATWTSEPETKVFQATICPYELGIMSRLFLIGSGGWVAVQFHVTCLYVIPYIADVGTTLDTKFIYTATVR